METKTDGAHEAHLITIYPYDAALRSRQHTGIARAKRATKECLAIRFGSILVRVRSRRRRICSIAWGLSFAMATCWKRHISGATSMRSSSLRVSIGLRLRAMQKSPAG